MGPVFLRVTVEQWGVDLRLELRDAAGSVLAEADHEGALWLPEVLSAQITEPRGELSLAVLAATPSGEPAPFELRIEELRSPQADDLERLEIDALTRAGAISAAVPSGESLNDALASFEAASARASTIGDVRREAEAELFRADVLLFTDRYADALVSARRALAHLDGLDDAPRLRAAALARLGWGLSMSGDWEGADAAFARAAPLLALPSVASLETELLRRRGEHAYRRDDKKGAEALFRAGLQGCAESPCDPREKLWLLTDLGAVQRYLGRYAEALGLYRQALEVVERLRDENGRALVLNNLGVLHSTRGEAAEALTSYRQAADLAVRVGRVSLAARATGNMGLIFGYLGDLDRALENSLRSLDLYRAMESTAGEAGALMELGWVREQRGEIDEALASFDGSLALSAEIGARHTEGLALVGRARALGSARRLDEALAALDRALPLLYELGDVTGRLEALRAHGETLLELDSLDEAEKSLREGLDLAVDLGDAGREAPLRALLCRAARRRGDLEEARRQIDRSLDLRESVRATLATPTLRASFQSRGVDDYLELLDLVLAAGQDDATVREAFEVAERGKARMLVEMLTEAQVQVERGVPKDLLEERGGAVGELSSAQLELRGVLADDARQVDEELVLRIARLQERLEALEWRIRESNPRYADLRYPRPATLIETQQLLDGDTALVEFALGEHRSHLFVLTANRAEVYSLPPRDALQPVVRALREDLESGGRSGRARLQTNRARLYDLLLRPAEDQLRKVGHLVIVPDQELFYVPFESLIDTSREGGTVVARWSVAYTPSATAMARLHQRDRVTHDAGLQFLGFADPTWDGAARTDTPVGVAPDGPWPPLPEARREIHAIAGLFPTSRRAVFLGEDANESRVKGSSAVRTAARIHFAAHTVIDTRRPGYSGLVLSPGGPSEDGFLQVHEIFDLDLDAQLVVLSGCRTGLGREVRGEGLIGMTQAFFYAGAEALLVSLWPVPDDSTAQLMVELYERLQAGARLDEALRQAKLSLLEENPGLHPFYWSAFVLVGQRA